MAVQNDNTILKKADLKAYHERIAPMLGGTFMVGTNVSDYYSTAEKVVGVWTDGKPIYQRTVIVTSDFGTNHFIDCYPETLVSFNDTIKKSNGSDTYETCNFWNSASDFQFGYSGRSSDGRLYMRVMAPSGVLASILEVRYTIQYTKTTDAAGSATTTPGAYDINFPNTWPVNQEIFFGNGLYGYRATGTVASTANARDVTQLFEIPANLTNPFVSQGGSWIRDDNNVAISFGASDSNGYSSNINYNGANGHVALISTSANARTNAPYDIWITYTK